MTPALKYTLARFALLAGVFLILLPVPSLSILVKAMLALLITMPLSWFLLRRWREQASVAMAQGLQRRKQRREQLRAALAGDDDNDANPGNPGETHDTEDIRDTGNTGPDDNPRSG